MSTTKRIKKEDECMERTESRRERKKRENERTKKRKVNDNRERGKKEMILKQ